MKLWIAIAGCHLWLQFVDGLYLAGTAGTGFSTWGAVLQPWGIEYADGLGPGDFIFNLGVYWQLISSLLAWDYQIFAGSPTGVVIRGALVGMTIFMVIAQWRRR